MVAAPLYSTLTLLAELVVSAAIYFVLYQGYKNNKFFTKTAVAALLYEIIFNISYMVMQTPNHVKSAKEEAGFVIALAITHGVLSLIMFVSLIVFFLLAWRGYKKGNNFFADHKLFTKTFLFFWTFSIISGVVFYLVEYVV